MAGHGLPLGSFGMHGQRHRCHLSCWTHRAGGPHAMGCPRGHRRTGQRFRQRENEYTDTDYGERAAAYAKSMTHSYYNLTHIKNSSHRDNFPGTFIYQQVDQVEPGQSDSCNPKNTSFRSVFRFVPDSYRHLK